MATWLIKEFSIMTNISVRSLHHYDRIGLLKPSKRLSNGYRVYSQFDLLKVQPILALRFLGFSLLVIKEILKKNGVMSLQDLQRQSFEAQEQLEELQTSCKALEIILQHSRTRDSIDLHLLLRLIEEHLFEELRRKILGRQATEIDQPAAKELALYRKRWQELIDDIERSLDADPRSKVGRDIAYRWTELIKDGYDETLEMKEALYHAYRSGKIPMRHLGNNLINWLDSALHHHADNQMLPRSNRERPLSQ